MNKVQPETLPPQKKPDASFPEHFIFKFWSQLSCFFKKSCELKRLPLPTALFLVILPVVFTGVYLCVQEFNQQTGSVVTHRESLATLESLFIQQKFDGVVGVATSLASCPCVSQNIENESWSESIKNMGAILQTLPYVDSVAILDKEGVLKAAIPPIPRAIGKSFAYSDYYQGVSREWKPYVSGVSMNIANTGYNVVFVAVPVSSSLQKVLGILLLTIKLDTIIEWSKEINVGPEGTTYLVDKNGKLVAPPNLKSGDNTTDYSTVSIVQKLLRGENGVDVIFNPDENEYKVAAYSPIKGYGFGVAVVQATSAAFSERSNKVTEYVMFWALIVLIFGFSSYRILKDRIAIIDQRDRERILLEGMGDGVVAIDRDWHITLWNKSASSITGWSKEEALGKPFREIVKFIRERDRKEDISFIEDAIVMGRTSFVELGTLLVKKDGNEIAVGDSVAPLFGQKGNMEGAIIVFRDVSKDREATHLRSDLAYATHQFRTPITEALWNLEIGINEENSEKRGEDFRVAHQALLSIKKLSEHLVSVSEIDQGDISVKPSMVSLVDILTEVQKKLEPETKKCDVAVFISPISPIAAINTDSKFLKRILYEIIENAVVYSRQGSHIIVSATFHKNELLIEVVDTGIGISEEQQPLIFTKFFRGTNSVHKSAGSGLGLYLAREYVKLLGGKIWFISEEGKGTTFYISVPVE